MVNAGEAFLCLNTALHLVLVALLVPDLETLVVFADKVSSNLVVNDTHEATTPILGRVSDIDTALAGLRIVGYTSRCHLVRFKLDS